MRTSITFLRHGRTVQLGDIAPTLTLLDYLRLTEHAVGTKEGCAEGDCGACTVVLRKRVNGKLVYQPVNSCILLAGQADGAEVITVEDLADGAALHPVQQQIAQPSQRPSRLWSERTPRDERDCRPARLLNHATLTGGAVARWLENQAQFIIASVERHRVIVRIHSVRMRIGRRRYRHACPRGDLSHLRAREGDCVGMKSVRDV